MSLLCVLLTGASFGWVFGSTALAQGPAANAGSAPPAFAMGDLRPALANVQTAIGNLSISRWKASSEVRGNAQQDVSSMQRDLTITLPPLLTQAEGSAANPVGAVSPAFAVFRNLDALYDVLLRVSETAVLTGPASDVSNLESARAGLENSRAKLGAWLLQAIAAQDARLAQAAAAPPPPVAAPPPNKIVVDDGPETPKPRKRKPAATPAPQ